MKKINKYLFLLTIIIMASPLTQAQTKGSSKALRHVVMFKFLDAATPEDVKKVEEAFAALSGKIKLIKGFRMGNK